MHTWLFNTSAPKQGGHFLGVTGELHGGHGLHRACGLPTESKPILHHIKMKATEDRQISRKVQASAVSN